MLLNHFVLIPNKLAEGVYSKFNAPCEKSKTVSMKNNAVFPTRSRFSSKLNCCIAFGSASRAWCLLKSIAISLHFFLMLG